MTRETLTSNALFVSAMAFVGFALGRAYFAALRRTIAGVAAGSGPLLLSALTLGRFAAAIILLALVARLGAMPLLATFFGFLIARAVALRTLKLDK